MSSIAAGLCGFYIGKNALTADIEKKISEDLTGKGINMVNNALLNDVFDFIENREYF